ncbi:hypothetical protein [Acinetobacter sp. ANC 4640]
MKIGIFWFYKNQIFGVSHEFDINSSDSLGMIDSPYNHVSYWNKLRNKLPELRNIEYEDVPRGRVIFDKNKNKLIIYLDKKLLVKSKVSEICNFFDAEYGINAILRLDPHYRT